MSRDFMHLVRAARPVKATRAGAVFSPEERAALFEQIVSRARPTATPPRIRLGRLRPARLAAVAITGIGAALAVLIATVLVGGSALGPGSAAGAVRFRLGSDGEIIATVTDPYAAESRLNAAFAAHGLRINVNLVPVSPSLVGTIVYTSDEGGQDQIESIAGGHCLTGGGGCPVGVKIPASFKGQGYITLGRAARAGESYDSTASAFAPGEALHCSGLLGARVGAALKGLAARHLSVVDWRVGARVVHAAPAANYVWAIDPVTTGTVRVWTNPAPWPDRSGVGAAYNRGCPHSAS